MEFCAVNNAQRNFSELLNLVSRGEQITITRRGKPVAILSPSLIEEKKNVSQVIVEILRSRKGNQLKGLSIREMREWGRR
ncbi:MAG: type II toxin-antitoxin system prevent-host-death family antitoxin [Candidatus Sumerlaeota bacterium]|nr:type II toxin-antitoxin system prevent-host-death family antitoxin [Candidatus Sumerlaeota bacterium]